MGDLADVAIGPSDPADLDLTTASAHLCGQPPLPGRTFFRRVERLEPGEIVEISPTTILRRRYWDLQWRPVLRLGGSREYAEVLREALFKVVSEYLPGSTSAITLSGGMDSTSVAAAAKAVAAPLQQTAIVWVSPEVPEADESAYARAVVDHLGLPAVELRGDLLWPFSAGPPCGVRQEPDLAHYPELWERTLATTSDLGARFLFTGAGGDNLFGGTVSAYPDLLLQGRWPELFRQIRQHLPQSEIGTVAVFRRMFVGAALRGWFGERDRRPPLWLTERARARVEELPRQNGGEGGFWPGRRLILAQLKARLPQVPIAQLQRRAGAHGIEFRHPLLDHRLMELAARLPPEQLVSGGERKFVLRNAMRGYLPESVISLRQKIIPLAIFDRGVERGRPVVERLLRDMMAADLGLVEPARLREGYEAYVAGTTRDGRFWQALTLEAWLRAYS